MRLFAAEALALFALASALLSLGQSLRLFDVVSVKGQDIGTLFGQVLLTMPTLAIAYLPICIAIGLARGLRALQQSQELHIIHSSRRLPALIEAISGYILIGALLMLLLTNFVEPTGRRHYNAWTASVAADLVSRVLRPHRFVEVADGVTLVIGSRGPGGELGSFFADDRRNPASRQTYVAKSASVAADAEGYVIRLSDGAIQYMSDDGRFSEITFSRYDLAAGSLTEAGEPGNSLDTQTTPEIIARAVDEGGMSTGNLNGLLARLGEGTRVLAFCLFIVAMAFFPSGRRTSGWIPLEILFLMVAFAERATIKLLPVSPIFASGGAIFIIIGGLVVLGHGLQWGMRPRGRAVKA
jgi:lipopolysaccharide export system permease protein